MATIAAALLVIALYATVGFQSPGYDDEYFNIGVIENAQTYAGIVAFAAGGDVHPPGQYLLNKALFDMLGDWSLVRAAQATLVSMTLVCLWLAVRTRERFQPAFAWLVLCLNPTLLMWGSGLRWYGPFVALLNLVLLVLLKPPRRPLVYWSALLGGLLALLYVGYVAIVVGPLVLAAALYQRRATLRRELPVLAGALAITGALALPQLRVFFSIPADEASNQTSSLLSNLAVLAVHLTSGAATMPLSAFGLTLALANATVLAVIVLHWRAIWATPAAPLLAGSGLALLAARLAAKLHTLAVLSPLQGLVQTQAYGLAPRRLRALLAALFALGNAGGIVNVATHADTAKGGWNTPYALVVETFRARTAACTGTLAITYDPVLAYKLRDLAEVVIFLDAQHLQERLAGQAFPCLVALETFRGALTNERWSQFKAAVAALPGRVSIDRLGPDSHAAFKRRFDPDVPDDYVTMTLYRR